MPFETKFNAVIEPPATPVAKVDDLELPPLEPIKPHRQFASSSTDNVPTLPDVPVKIEPVAVKDCCELPTISESYDLERLLQALGFSFALGAAAGVLIALCISKRSSVSE